MSAFKDMLAADVKGVFLSLDEFSDIHVINGKEMRCQVDNNEQIEREKRERAGFVDAASVYRNQKLIYVPAEDFGVLPKHGHIVIMDGRKYTVADAIDECGIYSITMEENRA